MVKGKFTFNRSRGANQQIIDLVETLQRRYHVFDPIVSTFDKTQLISNIDLICRAFYVCLTRRDDIDYIVSKLSAASRGMRPEERKKIFLEENLSIGNTVSYWQHKGHAKFYFCSFRHSPYLLIHHEYGTSVMNATEEVLQSIQEMFIEDLGFHLIHDHVPIFVKDVFAYYKVQVDSKFENQKWGDLTDEEQAWFNDLWEHLDNQNEVDDYLPVFFGKDRPYTAYKHIRRLFKRTSNELFIIDPYVNEDVFSMLETVPQRVKIRLLAKKYQNDSIVMAKRFRRERGNFDFRRSNKLHDRYLFCDDHCYLFGSSLNNFGALPTTIVPMRDKGLRESVQEYFDSIWEESESFQ